MTLVVTRAVSASLGRCELTHAPRARVRLERARRQHAALREQLAQLGCAVLHLPALDEHPDATFVEDVALPLGAFVVMTRPGAVSRRGEVTSLAHALSPLRELKLMTDPSCLDGGDVLRVGRTLYVGASTRTNDAARAQLAELVRPLGLRTRRVDVDGCLHLKTAASCVAPRTLLVNPAWVDPVHWPRCTIVEVDPGEPGAANTLRVGGTVVIDAAHARTARRLAEHAVRVATVDLSELAKAEAGPSCLALLLDE